MRDREFDLPEHVRQEVRRHRRRTAAVLGVLGLGVAALAGAAVFRTATPPAGGTASTAPDIGVLAASAGVTWHWAGTTACTPGGSPAALTRTSDGLASAVATPLLRFTGLSAADDSRLVALGRDDNCLPVLAVSDDAGATWQVSAAVGVLDARAVADGEVLAVRDDTGTGRVEQGPPGRLTPSDAECPDTLEARAVSDRGDRPFLLCEDDAGVLRLLQRSTGGGWEFLTDTRPGSGLDGTFTTRDLDVVLDGPGLLLIRTSRCPDGGLLSTSDGGESWQQLPCPSASLGGAAVLDLAVAPDGQLYLLVLAGGAATVVSSDDDGRTWRP